MGEAEHWRTDNGQAASTGCLVRTKTARPGVRMEVAAALLFVAWS